MRVEKINSLFGKFVVEKELFCGPFAYLKNQTPISVVAEKKHTHTHAQNPYRRLNSSLCDVKSSNMAPTFVNKAVKTM